MIFFILAGLLLGGMPAQAQRTVVHCGTLIDPGVSMTPMAQRTVIVEGGRVAAVEEGFTTNDHVVDLREAYCMPGLIDSHTHLTGQSRKGGYIDYFISPLPIEPSSPHDTRKRPSWPGSRRSAMWEAATASMWP